MPSMWLLSLRGWPMNRDRLRRPRRPRRRHAGRRLHPDIIEDVLAQQLAVGHAVQRHAAQADVLCAGLLSSPTGRAGARSPGDGLDRGREIHVMLRQQLGLARLAAEQPAELVVRHAGRCSSRNTTGRVGRRRLLEVDDLVEDQVLELRLAIGASPMTLYSPELTLEAGVVGEGRIEQANRARKVDLAQHLELVALAPSGAKWWPTRRRRPCRNGGLS